MIKSKLPFGFFNSKLSVTTTTTAKTSLFNLDLEQTYNCGNSLFEDLNL